MKVETSEEPEVTAYAPEETTTEPKEKPQNPNKETTVEPKAAPGNRPVTTATSDCDDEDECAEGTASGTGQPEETGEGATADTPVVATEERATKGTKVTGNTNGEKTNGGNEVVEVDLTFEVEEE